MGGAERRPHCWYDCYHAMNETSGRAVSVSNMMIVFEILIQLAAIAAVSLLIVHQFATQVNEYYFYKKNDWDFSIDSNLDRLKLDERISVINLNLTNWQRFFLFRPLYILNLTVLLGFMVWAAI